MREILFKAKRIDNGEWVEGYYCKKAETTFCFKEDYEKNPIPTHYYILVEVMTDWGLPNKFSLVEINPDTLCQYTGLTDKNGVKIWENDTIKYSNDDFRFSKDGIYYGVIKFAEDGGYIIEWITRSFLRRDLCFWDKEREIEVIGNVFDKSKLFKVE